MRPRIAHLYAYAGGDPISNSDPSGLLFGINAGEGYGDSAVEYWINQQQQTGNSLYAIPGTLAEMWTPCHSENTLTGLMGAWGLAGALEMGAFRFKTVGSNTWDAARKWMNKEGIQILEKGQQRNHWLFEQNQGIGENVADWIKNQPWNTNPISAEFNSLLGQYPNMAWLGGPAWAGWMALAGASGGAHAAGIGGSNCGCK